MWRLLHLVLVVLGATALAMVFSYPLVGHLDTHIPGAVAGDNLSFLWNVWWAKEWWDGRVPDLLHTSLQFAPGGASLVLNTHTALPSAVGAALLTRFSAWATLDLIVIGALALNGATAYWLAWDRYRSRGAAAVAAVVFGGSPYVFTHLLGHFNLIHAWVLPAFLTCVLRTTERRSLWWSVASGLVFVAAAFTDYYYTVYCGVIWLALMGDDARLATLSITSRRVAPRTGRLSAAAVVVLVAVALWIGWSGGVDTTVAGIRIRATGASNPLTFAWLIGAGLAYARWRPMLLLDWRGARPMIAARLRACAPMLAVIALGTLPIAAGAFDLWRTGDYTAPTHSWRSGPAGVDLATVVLGNPAHPWVGAWTRAWYERFGIDRVEEVAWIGVAPLLVLAWAFWSRRVRLDRAARGGALFAVWALGPWLMIGGFNSGLPMPANLLGLVPILSNARMPGRAMVVVALAVALLLAKVVSTCSPPRRAPTALLFGLLVIADYWPAPFPLTRVDVPALYSQLAAMPPGTVCELPMGLRDGFSQLGQLDDRMLLAQMVHRFPVTGGFLARIPSSTKKAYQEMPVLRSLLRLSDPRQQSPDPRDMSLDVDASGAALRRASVRYVVVNRARATPMLLDYVSSKLPLTLLGSDDERTLYEVGVTSPR